MGVVPHRQSFFQFLCSTVFAYRRSQSQGAAGVLCAGFNESNLSVSFDPTAADETRARAISQYHTAWTETMVALETWSYSKR